jgi:hypothetical protein
LLTPSLNTRATFAGRERELREPLGIEDHGTMSMRSPPSSLTTVCTREPLRPTHAPTGSMLSSREKTRSSSGCRPHAPVARISTMFCWISGTSSLNERLHEEAIGAAEDQRGPLGVSSTRLSTARIGSP